MIEEIRDYIALCPFIGELERILVNYLSDEVKTYSINEEVSYKPILHKFLNGYKECEFRFNLDCKFYWNEDIKNNIDNSNFFENFAKWLEQQDNNENYPKIKDVDISFIGTDTNGYIHMTESNEAIYRIKCVMRYGRY